MGLFRSLYNWARHGRDKAAKAVSNPVIDGKFAINDAKDLADDFEGQIRNVIAERVKLDGRLASARAEADKFSAIAKRAVSAGSDSDARSALQRKRDAEIQVKRLETDIKNMRDVVLKLRQQLIDTRQKITNAEGNHSTLAARHSAAKLKASAHERSQGLGKALGDLDVLEDAVLDSEAMATAYSDLSDPSDDLERKYSAPTNDIDAELASLKSASLKSASSSGPTQESPLASPTTDSFDSPSDD